MGTIYERTELGPFIRSHLRGPGDVAWRMEQLPAYAVDSDGDDFQRWLDGEPEPTWERKQLNFDGLAARAANGIRSERVRIFTAELTPYERYAAEWGYALNGPAGEDIRVLHRGEHVIPPILGFDYWLINEAHVARMHYDDRGQWEAWEDAPELLDDCLAEHDLTWSVAEHFELWYSRHPEHARRLAA